MTWSCDRRRIPDHPGKPPYFIQPAQSVKQGDAAVGDEALV